MEGMPEKSNVTEEDKDAEYDKAMKDMPIVQFSTRVRFCCEADGKIELDVLRIGNLSVKSVVAYASVDGTAKAGAKYTETVGELEFEPGKNEHKIIVPLLEDDNWDTTTTFKVELSTVD